MSVLEEMLFKTSQSVVGFTFYQKNASKSWASDIEFARMETANSRIPDTSFLVLKMGDCDDLDFW